jgi:hypothetical protein
VWRRSWAAIGDQCGKHFQQLMPINRATSQFKIDRDVIGNRGAGRQSLDVFGVGIDGSDEFFVIGPIAKGLDATSGRAGSDRD